jgi:hypothetical protein
VLTALDLKRAIDGTSKAMQFGFVTFLNHIALVVYQDDRSVFINNDIVHGPKQMTTADTKSDTTRADFALRSWGTLGFALVYKIRYSVALVRVPEQTVPSNLSDAAFTKKLWSFYKATAVWWGLQPGIADTYHQNVAAFNSGMLELERMLPKLTKNPSASQLVDVTTLATTLYTLADALASHSNFGQRPGVKGTVKEVSAMAVVAPAGKDLPIYAVVRLLAAAKKRGDTLTADQDALVQKPATLQDHADALSKVP